jgi:hypothetical protein
MAAFTNGLARQTHIAIDRIVDRRMFKLPMRSAECLDNTAGGIFVPLQGRYERMILISQRWRRGRGYVILERKIRPLL